MKRRTKLLAAAAGLTLCAGLLLGAAQGTQADPLVTLSYLNDVATPKILKEVDAKLASREQALVDKLNATGRQYLQEMQKLSASGGGQSGGSAGSSAFSVVTVAAGKKLIGGVGTEFLLRSGSATCVAASAPGLIDSTDGATLPSGGALSLNHLYLSTAEGRGLQATAACTVLVRGSYTLQ